LGVIGVQQKGKGEEGKHAPLLGQQRLDEAFAAAPEEWMKETTREQVSKLKALLAASPLMKLNSL
jgi:hypothetical protein